MIEAIPFSEFQTHIGPLWKASDPSMIPVYNNPYGMIAYSDAETQHRIILRCGKFIEDGVVKGYSSLYNISDTVVRFRGIYILPQYRGHGAGYRMCEQMLDLFPSSFFRAIGVFRETSVAGFVNRGGWKMVPDTNWLWSEFSQMRMRLLYRDRPKGSQDSRSFIDEQLSLWGLLGRQNLNQQMSPADWLTYVECHRGNYPSLNIDFNFS